jgi:hypothetical protein
MTVRFLQDIETNRVKYITVPFLEDIETTRMKYLTIRYHKLLKLHVWNTLRYDF